MPGHLSYKFLREWVPCNPAAGTPAQEWGVLQAIPPVKANHQDNCIPTEMQDNGSIDSQILGITRCGSQGKDGGEGVWCRRKRRGELEGKGFDFGQRTVGQGRGCKL